jgi:hypothetical protein
LIIAVQIQQIQNNSYLQKINQIITILTILIIITGVAPFNYVALPSNHPPPSPPLKLNLNSKKRKIKTKIWIINQDCIMYVPFVEQEIPNNLI